MHFLILCTVSLQLDHSQTENYIRTNPQWQIELPATAIIDDYPRLRKIGEHWLSLSVAATAVARAMGLALIITNWNAKTNWNANNHPNPAVSYWNPNPAKRALSYWNTKASRLRHL